MYDNPLPGDQGTWLNQNINKNAENLGHVTPGGELKTSTQIHNQKENTCIHKYLRKKTQISN